MRDPREFFPGDPPLLEGLLWLLTFGAFTELAILLVTAGLLRRLPSWKRALPFLMVLAMDAAFLINRHVGPWRALQLKLLTFEREVRVVRENCGHYHNCTVEFLDSKYGATEFRFTPEHDPVRLFVRPSDKDFVAVDFGHGSTAVFDHTWMVTVYSD